jgi:hypothetical protein
MVEAGRVLHLVQGYSAAGSLRQAFQAAGCADEIAVLPDDLSCGRIDQVDAEVRIKWRGQYWDLDELTPRMAEFWARVADAAVPEALGRVVVWAGRARASDHCFLLAVAGALRGRAFGLIACAAGDAGVGADSAECVAHQLPDVLRGLIGTERMVGPEKQAVMAARWEVLQRENTPFRVVRVGEVVSVTEDYFDAALLAEAGREPVLAARVVGGAMGRAPAENQVGDLMLIVRLVALVEAGRLLAEGDPWDIRACRVWVAD